jgi:SWI/SNF-related matrix-associated actin-dependent regulator 1 of chromatin subfamily A
MRLGKTPQVIRVTDRLNALPILILCPAIARLNWSREFAKFSSRSLSITTLLSARQKNEILGADVVICSYDLTLNTGIRLILLQRQWSVLVLDEVHYLKSIEAKRTSLVFGKGGIVHKADRVYVLSATPAPNHAAELYPLLRVFGAYSGSLDSFVKKFCTGHNTPYGFKITGTKNVDELKALLAPIMLRRTKKEVRPDLPTAQFSDIVVEPTELEIDELELAFMQYLGDPRGMKGVEQDIAPVRALLEAQFAAATTEEEKLAVLGASVTNLAMLRRYIGMLKVGAIAELVKSELDNGLDKIVIFAIHKAVIEGLRDRLAEFKPVTIYGGTPPEKRDRHLHTFATNDRCRVFIGNITACGVAISLAEGASDVLFAEADWVPMNNAQAAARVDGPAQKNPIFVRFVGLAGSVDEYVSRTLARKTADLSKIFS